MAQASDTPDDLRLLRLIEQGDQPAFGQLSARHAQYLYGIAHALTQNAADADDLVQETFLAMLQTRFRGESAVRTWLVQILVRQAAWLARTRKRSMRLVGRPDEMTDQAGSVDAKLDLAVMLEALSPEHREVIVLRELEQMSYDEMAQTLGVPRGTIESRLHRARAELKKRWAQ